MMDRETFARITHPDYVDQQAARFAAEAGDDPNDRAIALGVARAVISMLGAEVDTFYPERPDLAAGEEVIVRHVEPMGFDVPAVIIEVDTDTDFLPYKVAFHDRSEEDHYGEAWVSRDELYI